MIAQYSQENRHSSTKEMFEADSGRGCCKICLERDEGTLVSPCNCTGSIRFVHKECLRVWLQASLGSLRSYTCELCHEEVEIECTTRTAWNSSVCQRNSSHKWCVLVLLFLGLASLLGILFVVLGQMSGSNVNYNSVMLLIVWICAVTGVAAIIVNVLKNWCWFKEIVAWQVVHQVFKETTEQHSVLGLN